MEVEPDLDVDRLVVLARTAAGGDQVLWDKSRLETMGRFTEVAVSLAAFAGEEVSLMFSFDTSDAIENDVGGVWLDDVRVLVSCSSE